MMKSGLAPEYIDALRSVYLLHGKSDLCCYWFEKSRRELRRRPALRVGLLATQAIRHGGARGVLDEIKKDTTLFFAESNREWKQDGASVVISMIGFGNTSESPVLDGKIVPFINADLSTAADVTIAKPLQANFGISFEGDQKGGPFDAEYETFAEMITLTSPHGRPYSDVLRPRANAERLFKRRSPLDWIIDFGSDASQTESASYEYPFEYLNDQIQKERKTNPKAVDRKKWWIHKCPRPELRSAINGLHRYLATGRVSTHRLFIWVDSIVLPDSRLFAFATDSDFTLGLLQSSIHERWALRQGAKHGGGYDPTYNNVRCFETFPFPEPIAAKLDAIAAAAKELDTLRSNWLNPPEWTREEVLTFPGSADGPWARYVTKPDAKGIGIVRYPRVMPADDAAAKKLAKRTLTNLYNEPPTWLDLAHTQLDEAVFAAYGWPADLTDDNLLARLLRLNLDRAAAK
jgi:hypothetical protein